MAIIHKTENYSIFKFLTGNRPTRKFNTLLESIKKRNMLEHHPIHVDENMHVIDGQHRLQAAQILKVPVYYTIDPSACLDDIALLNANMRAWTSKEFTHLFSDKGSEDYKFIYYLAEKFKFDYYFTIYTCCNNKDMKVSKNKSTIIKEYKSGNLKLKNDKKKLEEEFIKLKELFDLSSKEGATKTSALLHSFLFLIRNEKYNHENMLNKIVKYPDDFKKAVSYADSSNIQEYLVSEVYNKGLRKSDRIII
jgi:hypothetical protein